MSANKQFRVCAGVVLSFEMMQGYVMVMLHSDALHDVPPVLIACESFAVADVMLGGDSQSIVLGRLHVCMRADCAAEVFDWLQRRFLAAGGAR
ncbi:hypothetical protein FQK02_06365 [Xanthomonas vasicola]|uniref:Uncharacterized protein n=1 Tax=Xanthomonas vasicola pv. vasculorum NCPPB 890 TaxID=1184265 RepID=A0A836NZP8_XANVA|nr:hypothetical protein [Xanthomonas vasicola]KFA30052.1 hypothetical protein KWG_0113925 [Xanthomonas vasicola pv. vasculorum NCPPB 1381]KFA30913.1 hypothetical protein KW5_0103705 [Xanthomonas vasicola pv. vasculorum NCPPB 1326]KFA37090.1 hypothetical protein KWI_0106860 [Xanthomonas vasicola pv. vasculorum NCPPB 206]MBV6747890.1 hypothetical protein [Xanthomonas vasicola pv. vasculorum NCPPB 890]MBV6893694.1 hypothetical protein [Xanthomonas vasicola pv. vasculorum]